MRILKIVLGIMLLAGILCGCDGRSTAIPDFREKDFRAEIRWSRDGMILCANLTVTSEKSEENSRQKLRLEFLSPDSLSGLCVEETNGEIILSRNQMQISLPGAEGFLSVARLLTASGERTDKGDIERNGIMFRRMEIRNGSEVYEYELEKDTGIPKKISGDGTEAEIIRFSFLT